MKTGPCFWLRYHCLSRDSALPDANYSYCESVTCSAIVPMAGALELSSRSPSHGAEGADSDNCRGGGMSLVATTVPKHRQLFQHELFSLEWLDKVLNTNRRVGN